MSDLANKCNMNISYLSMIVNGHRSNVNESILESLAHNLGVSKSQINELLKPSINEQETSCINNELQEVIGLLEEVLNALELNNQADIKRITTKLYSFKNKVPLAHRYTEWYEGWQLALNNSFGDALNLFNKSREFKMKTQIEKRCMAKIMSSIGGAQVAQGHYTEAMKAFRKSLLLWDSGKQASLVYLNMGTLHRRNHRYNVSIQSYKKAFVNGSNFVKFKALSSLCQVAVDRNDLTKARELILKGYCISKHEPDPRGKDDLFCTMGTYYKLLGNYTRAKRLLNKSIDFANRTGDRRIQQYAIAEIIEIDLSSGNIEKADQLLNSISASYNNDILYLATYLCAIAKRHQLKKKFYESYLILNRCYKLLNLIPPTSELLLCCSLLEKYHLAERDPYVAKFYGNEIRRIKKIIK